jgi:GNAT superfamily N-acetyltransferase
MYQIERMSFPYANEISGWAYPDEYAVYSFVNDEDAINELLSGEYYACLDSARNLTGYFCFGRSARIPTAENGVYGLGMLDMGLGLKPDLCGKGLGYAFMKAGMEYANANLKAKVLRLTVAGFNKRAMNLYRKLGFEILCEVTHKYSLTRFYVMNCVSNACCDS